MLFLKIDDPYKASYSIENPNDAVALLTLTLMRNEIGKIELDKLFQERDNLNQAILTDLKESTDEWGIKCLRYEILNIDPPDTIKKSM
jgi:regulator of protease activity HflC (stomatin/prohibitin superfamily)